MPDKKGNKQDSQQESERKVSLPRRNRPSPTKEVDLKGIPTFIKPGAHPSDSEYNPSRYTPQAVKHRIVRSMLLGTAVLAIAGIIGVNVKFNPSDPNRNPADPKDDQRRTALPINTSTAIPANYCSKPGLEVKDIAHTDLSNPKSEPDGHYSLKNYTDNHNKTPPSQN